MPSAVKLRSVTCDYGDIGDEFPYTITYVANYVDTGVVTSTAGTNTGVTVTDFEEYSEDLFEAAEWVPE